MAAGVAGVLGGSMVIADPPAIRQTVAFLLASALQKMKTDLEYAQQRGASFQNLSAEDLATLKQAMEEISFTSSIQFEIRHSLHNGFPTVDGILPPQAERSLQSSFGAFLDRMALPTAPKQLSAILGAYRQLRLQPVGPTN